MLKYRQSAIWLISSFVMDIYIYIKSNCSISCSKLRWQWLILMQLFWQLHIIHIYKQLKLFEHYQQRLGAHIGAEGAQRLVNKALVLITLGGNDFVNNYYLVPYSARSRQFSLPDYVTYLISEYRPILKVVLISQ